MFGSIILSRRSRRLAAARRVTGNTTPAEAIERRRWKFFWHGGSLLSVFAVFLTAHADEARAASPVTQEVAIAAAANFVHVLPELEAAFHRQNPTVHLTAVVGATGSLVAQIERGAPYDLLLAADAEYPRALVAHGEAEPSSFAVFATGTLVLWTTQLGLPLDSVRVVIQNPQVKRIAIANPKTAPYGRAAIELMQRMGLWSQAQSRIVTGENISQTAQFVQTGNADVGFVARSLVEALGMPANGRWLTLSPELYSPLEHAAVLTRHGRGNAAAARYLAFLQSSVAREIFARFGYGPPRNTSR